LDGKEERMHKADPKARTEREKKLVRTATEMFEAELVRRKKKFKMRRGSTDPDTLANEKRK
jgi:hypothetical protein